MSNGKPTVDEVVAKANAARESLAALERDLQEDIDAIDLTAFKEKRDRTPAELAKRKELRASQSEVREGFKVLAFVTAQRLDDTAEVQHLIRRMDDVNAGLQDDLDRLKKIEKYAAIAAKVADALAKVGEKLAKVAAKGIV
ncbi:MAG: hypothetical protein ACFB13_03015 [Kiloniellaceae bacterium]